MVTVKINGMEYNLKGEEQEEYLHKVAGYVDKKVKSILENNSKLSTSSAAVLSAVNVVDEMFKKQREYEKFLDKVEEIQNKQKDYEKEIESLRGQLKHMQEYNAELQLKLKNNSSNNYTQQEEELRNIRRELDTMKEQTQKHLLENINLKTENKELKFQLQSAKYKTMDLQHKLIENQINLAKEKKQNNPLLKDSEK
jgi:cell division protein ZapA